jgi:hypothetical protein
MTANTVSDDNGSSAYAATDTSGASYAVTPVGPSTDALKEAFSAQKIPLQTDFANLIDVANCGRLAAGLSPDQPGETGAGLLLDDLGRLAVRAMLDQGLIVSSQGVGLALQPGKGLIVDAGGLAIKSGGGINLGATGVGVTANAEKGITVDGSGVGLSLQADKGLVVNASGLAIRPGSGINLGATGIGVTANAGRAIIVDGGGVGINFGSTLQVTSNQLGVSDSAFKRKTSSITLPKNGVIWKQIMYIPYGTKDAYAQIYITSNGGQKFVLTVCCDGGVYYYGGTYSISLSNVYRGSEYGIGSIRIGYDYYANTCVDVEITHTAGSVPLSMNYALSDIEGVQLKTFVDLINNGGSGVRNRGTISTIANGSIQGK